MTGTSAARVKVTWGDEIMGQMLSAVARGIAERAHQGQVDKAGKPYIGHPARVVARLGTDEDEAVGWLHDVVEDTDLTLMDLRAAGMPESVVQAVDALTRRDREAPLDYYERVAANPLALRVKHADLGDNTDPNRLAALDDATRQRLLAKYRTASEVLDRLESSRVATASAGT